MLIYVVDDHDLMRDATVIVLRYLKKDAGVKDFSSFESFLRAVDNFGPPDLLILDLILPNIIGCQGVHQARQKCANAKIAVYSALPAAERASECLMSGADVYVEKSNGVVAFKDSLKRLIN